MNELELAQLIASTHPQGSPWGMIGRHKRVALLALAIYVAPSLERNPPSTPEHMAHRLHAAYMLASYYSLGVPREGLRCWGIEPEKERAGFVRAGAVLFAKLNEGGQA